MRLYNVPRWRGKCFGLKKISGGGGLVVRIFIILLHGQHTVLRFSDEEVLNNMQAVFNYLEDWIEKKINQQV